MEIQEDINIEGPPDGKGAVGQMLLRVRKTLGRSSSTFDANEDVILADKSNRDLLFNDLNKAYDKIGRPRLSRNDFDLAVVGKPEGTEPPKPVQVPTFLQPARPSQGPSLTQVTGQQAMMPMAPEKAPKTKQGPSLTDVTRQQLTTPMAVPQGPNFQQWQNQAEIDQAAKSPVFLANKAANAVLADRQQMAEANPLTWRQDEKTGKFGVFEKNAPIESKPLATFDTMNQAAAAIKTRGAASDGLIFPTKEAEREFQKLSPEQQQVALEGSTGAQFEQNKKDNERSFAQKYGIGGDFDKTMGELGLQIGSSTLEGIKDYLKSGEGYRMIQIQNEMSKPENKGRDPISVAQDVEVKLNQELYDAQKQISERFDREIKKNNISTDAFKNITEGNWERVPESVLYTVGSVIMQVAPSIATYGTSTYFQTLPQVYKAGVDARAKELGITPEEVIRSGQDGKTMAKVVGLTQAALERVGAGMVSSSIAKKGGYTAVRDWVIGKLGKSTWSKAAGRGAGLGFASGGEGATGGLQEVTSVLQEGKMANKGILESFEGQGGRILSAAGNEAIGGFGAAGLGRAFAGRGNDDSNIPPPPPSQLGGIPTQQVNNKRTNPDGSVTITEFDEANIPQQYRDRVKKEEFARTGLASWFGGGKPKYKYQYTVTPDEANGIEDVQFEDVVETPEVITETPVDETTGEAKTGVTFENAKEGDVVFQAGKPVTVVGRTKSRAGRDVIEVQEAPRTKEEIKQAALERVFSRVAFEYGNRRVTWADIEANHPNEVRKAIEEEVIVESSRKGTFTIDAEQWANEVTSTPEGPVVTPESDTTFVTVTDDELNAFQTDPNFAENNPERVAGVQEDADAVRNGEMTLEEIEDPNYRTMVQMQLEANKQQPNSSVGKTFTLKDTERISDGTGLQRKGSLVNDPELVAKQLSVGDKLTFFQERERTGTWDGNKIIEDGTNNPWGLLGVLSDGWVINNGQQANDNTNAGTSQSVVDEGVGQRTGSENVVTDAGVVSTPTGSGTGPVLTEQSSAVPLPQVEQTQQAQVAPAPVTEGAATPRSIADIEVQREKELKNITPALEGRRGIINANIAGKEVSANLGEGFTNIQDNIPLTPEEKKEVLRQYRLKDDGDLTTKELSDWKRDFSKRVLQRISNEINAKYDAELAAFQSNAPTRQAQVGEIEVDVNNQTDAEIEGRMAEIEGNPDNQKEFNALENEMEKREKASVFDVPLADVGKSVDALLQKEKDKPNGYGAFIEKRDARETKEVADRYLDADKLTERELMKDFSDGVLGNPTTWYADGLKIREALNEATKRGIDTEKMLADVVKVFTNDGYGEDEAKRVVGNILAPIFNKDVASTQPAQQGAAETKLSDYGKFLLDQLELAFKKKYPNEKFDRNGISEGIVKNRGTNTGRMESDLMELIGSYIDPSIRVPAAQALKVQFNKLKEQAAPTPSSLADQIADLRAKEQAELDRKIKNADNYRGADGRVDRKKLNNNADRAAYDEVSGRYDKPISDLLAQQKKEGFGSLRDVELTMRRPEKNEIVFVPIDALLEKQAADQPSYDIQKEENRIKGRVEKAKEFLKNYLKDQRALNPKTGKRTDAKVSFEPSVVNVDANGKISFEDGRHRVLAAKELGLTEVPIEVPKGKGNAIQDLLAQQGKPSGNAEMDEKIRKQKQLDIINKTNPAPNDQNTWVRNVEDILSPEQAFKDDDNFIGTPDFTIKDAKKALEDGEVIVYSSYPIKDGVFVTPSKMEATLYAGTKTPYSKKVKLRDVAWIDSNQGQYAEVKTEQVASETKGKESPKVIDRNATQALLAQANDELAAAKSAFDKKKAELNKTTKEDAPDLFGKRKVESEQGLFEMPRIDPAQREKVIQPFRDRFEKAKAEVNRLTTLLNEGQEVTQELKFESDEQVQTTGTEVRKGKGGTKDEGPVRKKNPPVRNAGRTPDAIAARNIQFFGDPYYSSLQYMMDMTYHPDLLQSIFGGPDKNSKSGRKNIEGERKPRIQFLDKKSNIKTADRLGELLAEKYAEDNNMTVQEAEDKHNFRDIAESIILNHSSRNQMVKAILDQNDMVEEQHKFQYDPEGIYGEDFNEDAAKDVDNSLDDIPDSYWEGMDLTDEQYNELFAPDEPTPSTFTAFDTKGEAARKAREALKEQVGIEEYNRMEAAYRNEKEKAKAEKEEAAKQEKKEEKEKEEDTTPLSAEELTGNKIIEEAASETQEGKSEYENERDQKVSFTEALKADVKAFLSNGFDGIKKYSKKAQAYIENVSKKVVKSAIIAITAGGSVFGVGSKLVAESDGGLAVNTLSLSGMSQMVNRGLTKMGLLDIDVNEGKVDTKTITKQTQETVPVKDGVDFKIRGSVVDNRDPTGQSKLWMYVRDAANGMLTYVAGPNVANMPSYGKSGVSNVEGVGHFMISNGDLTTLTNDETLAQLKIEKLQEIAKFNPDNYIPTFQRINKDTVGLTFKKLNEITEDDIVMTQIVQIGADNINWDAKAKAPGFKSSVFSLTDKSGKPVSSFLFAPTKQNYNRFSGGAYYILAETDKGLMVREMSGSIDMLHSDVDDVAKKYNIPLSKIKIGVMDAGSFSAKPQAKGGTTNFADYQGYNPNKAVGSSLNIPLGGSALDAHIDAVDNLRKKLRNKTYSDPFLLSATGQALLDAYSGILKAARAAGKIITRGQAMYAAQKQINAGNKYSSEEMADAAKAVYNYEKGTIQSDINKATGVKNVSVKKAVQNAIDEAYAIGLGYGKQQGFQKGATEGQKSGFITGKEVGVEQGQEMGIKEGKLAAAKTMKALLEGLKAELNPRQINGILEKFAKQRDFSPEGKQAFMDYVNKVIDDANYVLNERAAAKLKGRVKSMSQSDRTPANDQSLFKAFASLSINHMDPDALQSFINWGTQIVGKSLKNRTQLMEFIKAQKQVQDQITNERSEKMRVGRERNLKEEYEKAKNEGELPDGVTTFEEFVDSKKPTPKQKTDMNARIAALEIPEDTDKETRRVLETLKKQNLSLLSENDLVLLENAISNFEDTGELFAVGDIAAKAEVYNAVDNLVKQNIVFNKQVDTKAVKKRSLTNLLNKYVNLSKNVAKLRNTIIQPWLTASSKVYSAYVVEEGLLLQEAKKQGLKQDNFNRIDLFGFLNEAEGNPELFDALKEQKLSDLEKLANQIAENKSRNDKTESAKAQKLEYESLKKAVESLGLTADSKLEDLKLSEGEKKWYDEARKILDKYGARAIKNMSLYGNQEVGMVQNYWPRNVVKTQAQSDEQTIPDKLEDFSLYNSSGKVGGNLFGRQKGRTNLVGKNGYYQPDGKVNLFNGLRETMMIAMAAKEYHQMQAMYNSSKGLARLAYGRGFNTLKGTLIQYILDTKNHGKYNLDDRTRFHKFKNHVMSAVTGGLIKNITQFPKQLTALANTAAMAPQSTAAATGIAIKAMLAPKGSPLRTALESFVNSGTLGIRLSIPEMLEISSQFAEDKNSVEQAYEKFSNILDKISGGKGLEWTDKQVSIIATLAGYIQNQIQNGKIKNAAQFDLIKEDSKGWDGEAMSAGEQMQGKSNNENTRILFSQRQKDTPLLYFLTNFTHQMVMSAYDNVAKIGDQSVPTKAKMEALQNLGGVVMAGILFQVARSYANGAIDSLFEKIKEETSGDDEEEKERKRKMLREYEEANRTKKLISSTLQETFNYVGGTQNIIVQEAINNGVAGLFEAYQAQGRKMEKEGELPEMLKESVKKDNNPFYSDGTVGQAGIISDAFIKPLVMSAKSDDPTGRLAQEAEILALKLARLPAPAYLLSRQFAGERKEEKAKDLFEKKEKKEIAEDFSPGSADEKIARKKLLNYLEIGDIEKAKKELAKSGETYVIAESIMTDKNNKGIPNKNEYAILEVAQGKEKDATIYLADGSETTVKKFYAGRPDALSNLLIKYKAQEARQRKQLRLLNQIKPKGDNTDYLKEYFYSKLND